MQSVDLHDRQTPIVHTSYGDVQGIQHRLPSGVTVDVFLGIPFAKPPVEELRFEVENLKKFYLIFLSQIINYLIV